MSHPIRNGFTHTVKLGQFIDTNGDPVTNLTIANTDIRISKEGAPFENAQNGATHVENGWYTWTLSIFDTDVIGSLEVYVQVPGALYVSRLFHVYEAAIYDSFFGLNAAGFENNRVNVGKMFDQLLTTQSGANFNTFFDNGSAVSAKIQDDVQTAAEVQTSAEAANKVHHLDRLLADVYDASAPVGNANALWRQLTQDAGAGVPQYTTTALANVKTQTDQSLVDIHLDHLFATAYNAAVIPGDPASWATSMTENGGGGVPRYTAAALINAPGGGASLTQQDVRDAMKLTPTGGAPSTGSIDEHLDSLDNTKLTTARANNLDNLDATVSSRATPADVKTQADQALVDIHLDHMFATLYDGGNEPGNAGAWANILVEQVGATTRTQFTVEALENAAGGGGGDKDWTDAERSQIRNALGMTGDLATPTTGNGKLEVELENIKGTGFNKSLNSLKAIRDRGDIGWITAVGFSTHSVADIWNEPQAGYTTAGTFGFYLDDQVSSGTTLTQQEVRDSMKLAPTGGAPAAGSVDEHLDSLDVTKLTTARATNLDNLDATVSSRSSHSVADIWNEPQAGYTTPGTFGFYLDSQVSAGGLTAQNVWEYVDRTLTSADNVTSDGTPITTVSGVVASVETVNTMAGTIQTLDALDAAQDAQHAITQGQIGSLNNLSAAEVWQRVMVESYAAVGAVPTAEQMMFMLYSALSQFQINTTTITSKRIDGTTTAMTFTLDDTLTPTSRVRAT